MLLGLLAAALWAAWQAKPPASAGQFAAQAQVWSEIPRWRSFAAFHSLFLALFGLLGGTVALLFFAPSGRWLVPVGALGLISYFTLEPRATNTEIPLVAQLAFIFFVSAISPRGLRTHARGGPLDWLVFFAPPAAAAALIEFARTQFVLPAVSSTVEQELLLSAIYAVSGSVTGAALWGPAAPLFEDSGPAPSGTRSRRQVIQAFLLTGFLCAVVGFMLIDSSNPELRKWIFVAPVVPPFMALYAPYRWLVADSETTVFGPAATPNLHEMQFFVGVIFEYLCLGTLYALIQSVRRPGSLARFLIALGCIVLYWAPALWLLATMNRTAPGTLPE